MNDYYSMDARLRRAHNAESKKQERDVRRDRGEVRVDAWLSPRSAHYLEELKKKTGRNTSEVVDYAIDAMGYANLQGEAYFKDWKDRFVKP